MPDTTAPATLEDLRQSLPEVARDLKLNLQSVLKSETLTPAQTWGVAICAACFVKNQPLRDALIDQALNVGVGEDTIDDAKAAAALMAMTTTFYRFRDLVGKESYSRLPARLRMSRLSNPASTKADLELFGLAAAALAPCEACIKAHEAGVLKHGLTENHVHDTLRIASVIQGVDVALGL